jgi:AcrR family transcriptional regulator
VPNPTTLPSGPTETATKRAQKKRGSRNGASSRRAPRDGVAKKSGARKSAVASSRRVRLQVDERRVKLIELGIELFSTRSYEDISIDDVAAAAGISKGLLYHYFRSKQEFYVETIRAASLHLRDLTQPNRKLPPVERLRAAIDAHLGYVHEHSRAYAAIYRNGVAVSDGVGEILEDHRAAVMRYFLQNIGIRRPSPVLRAAIRGWILMVEASSLDWLSHPDLRREDFRELLIAGYVAMLARAMELAPRAARPAKSARTSRVARA